jgi:hypothetical protein
MDGVNVSLALSGERRIKNSQPFAAKTGTVSIYAREVPNSSGAPFREGKTVRAALARRQGSSQLMSSRVMCGRCEADLANRTEKPAF